MSNENKTNRDNLDANLVTPSATGKKNDQSEHDSDDSSPDMQRKRRPKKDLFGGKKKKAALPKKSTKALELTHVVPAGDNPVHGFVITMEGDGEKFLSGVMLSKEKKQKKEAFIEATDIINWTFTALDSQGQPQKNLKNYNKKAFVVVFPKDSEVAEKEDLLEWIEDVWVDAIDNLHEGRFTEATRPDPKGQGDEWYFKVDSWSKILPTPDIIIILQRDTVVEHGFKSAETFFATPESSDAVYSCWNEGEVPKQAVKELKFSEDCLRGSDKHLVATVKQDKIDEETMAKKYGDEQKKMRRDKKKARTSKNRPLQSVSSDADTTPTTHTVLIHKCLTSYFTPVSAKKKPDDDTNHPSRENSNNSEAE